MQVFKVFEKSLNCVKKRRKSLKVFNSLVSVWLYDFLANKIHWLKHDFRKYRPKKAHFRMWLDGTNYWVKMVLTLVIFRQLIALKGLWKVFDNRQKKSLKVFELFWSWRLRTLSLWTCALLSILVNNGCVNLWKLQYFLLWINVCVKSLLYVFL
jgi:hypothetical protein